LPVVATEVSRIPEAVLHGETGLLVKPNATLPLADALEQILADPRRAADFGRAGARLVRAQFALDVSSRRLAATFRATGRGDANFGG